MTTETADVRELWSISFPGRETPSDAQIARWVRTFTTAQIRRGIYRASKKFKGGSDKTLADVTRYADSVMQHELYQSNPTHTVVPDDYRPTRTAAMTQEWADLGLPAIPDNWLSRWACDDIKIISLGMSRTRTKLRFAPQMSTNDLQRYFASVVRNQVAGISEVRENQRWSVLNATKKQ